MKQKIYFIIILMYGCSNQNQIDRIEPAAVVKGQVSTSSTILSIKFSPTNPIIATAVTTWDQNQGRRFHEVVLRDAGSLHVIRTIAVPKQVQEISFSPDGKVLAVADGDYQGMSHAYLFDSVSGDLLRTMGGSNGWIHGLAFSPDGGFLVSCGSTWNDKDSGYDDGKVTRWVVGNGQEEPVHLWKEGSYRAVAFSPVGQTYVTGGGICSSRGSNFGEVHLWDAATGQTLWSRRGHTEVVECVALAPDGNAVASGGMDGVLKLWDAASGKETFVARMKGGRFGRVLSVTFSPDGKYLIAGLGSYNRGGSWGEIRAWEIQAQPVREISIFDGAFPIKCVAFSIDGQSLVAGDSDGTFRAWKSARLFAVTPEN